MESSDLFSVKPIQSDFHAPFNEAFVVAKFSDFHEFVLERASHVSEDIVTIEELIRSQQALTLETHDQQYGLAIISFYGRQEDAEFSKIAQARNLVKLLKMHNDASLNYTITNAYKWCFVSPDNSQQSFSKSISCFRDYINLYQEVNTNMKTIQSYFSELFDKTSTILKSLNEQRQEPVNLDDSSLSETVDGILPGTKQDKKNFISKFEKILQTRRLDPEWVKRIKETKFKGLSINSSQEIANHLINGPADVSLFMRHIAKKIYGVEAIATKVMGRNGQPSKAKIKQGDRQKVFSVDEEKILLTILSNIDQELFESDAAWSALVKLPVNQAGRDAKKQLKKLQEIDDEDTYLNEREKSC